jgi:bifunctional DNA-binding transcriptional regulator/antitoxin component of YhaV-PrlF toxin-antitoxin module
MSVSPCGCTYITVLLDGDLPMPQLVKGEKHVYGWSKVGAKGTIPLPSDARKEYHLSPKDKVILCQGSKTSGGFSVIKEDVFRVSQLFSLLDINARLEIFQSAKDVPITYKKRIFFWTKIRDDGSIHLPLETLQMFGIQPGDQLLVARGSGLGVGFLVRGPIIQEAQRHTDLTLFE